MPLLLLFFISRWLSCHTLRWRNNFSSAVMSLSSLSRQTDLWVSNYHLNQHQTAHSAADGGEVAPTWTSRNRNCQLSAVWLILHLIFPPPRFVSFLYCGNSVNCWKKWYVSGEIAVFAEAVPSSLPGLPGFVREDLKLLTVSECRTCVLYFAGSRENEVDQVDKDYKNYKVHKVNWAEVNKMHLCWVFHIKIWNHCQRHNGSRVLSL